MKRALSLGIILLGQVSSVAAGEVEQALGNWERVLDRFVDDRGRVAFRELATDRAELDAFVSFVAEVAPWSHPELFPAEADRLAFHINAYNALSMSGILGAGIPEDLDGAFRRLAFFKRTKYRIGGREMSLHAYENEVIRAFGDPRIHFAITCMSVGCPRLRRESYRGGRLDDQLEAAAREFFNNEPHLRMDGGRRRIELSSILKWFKEDFINGSTTRSTIDYVNRYRSDPVPTDYKVKYIAYDWTVIAQ
jgi:hypothetical protein